MENYHKNSMRLNKLLKNIKNLKIFINNKPCFKSKIFAEVSDVCINSQDAKKNSMFIALKGSALNGENYIFEAIKNGASVIVSENKLNVPKQICLIVVQNARKFLALVAAAFYNNAHKKLKIIGITGTNGKSSCAYILHHVFTKISEKNNNFKCGLIGTNAVFINKQKFEATLTTPDPLILHKIFYNMVKSKVKICVMEVSSHSVYFSKIFGINFEVLCLTNVKTDHLDFFKTQKNYEKQKESLFLNYKAKNIVVNLNDKIGKRIVKKLNKKVQIWGFKKQGVINKNLNVKKCLYKYKKQSIKRSVICINLNGKKYEFNTNLFSDIYAQNLSLCICVLRCFKVPICKVLKEFSSLYIEGRLNVLNYNSQINFVLDYAHTLSSTKFVLKSIKKVENNKNIIIVGSPGNRDEFKRKKIAKQCLKFGDVILTSDNPKYENPYKIMEEMKKGANKKNLLIENREIAIKFALLNCIKNNKQANIIILGKGIENYQDYNNNHINYSDLKIIENLIKYKK